MICVHASLAAKWVLIEERTDRARALYRTAMEVVDDIVAPPLLLTEVTNILYQRTRRTPGMSFARVAALLEEFLSLNVVIHSPAGLHQRALALAHAYGLPAAYDAHYLALAEHFGCELWTDDGQLVRRAENDLPFVRRLSEYPRVVEG